MFRNKTKIKAKLMLAKSSYELSKRRYETAYTKVDTTKSLYERDEAVRNLAGIMKERNKAFKKYSKLVRLNRKVN